MQEQKMLEVILKGHDKFYLVSDVVRMFCGVPEELKRKCRTRLPDELEAILLRFEKYMKK